MVKERAQLVWIVVKFSVIVMGLAVLTYRNLMM